MRCFLVWVFSYALLLPVATGADTISPEKSKVPQSRFVRTALALQSAPATDRTQFASIALAELAATYLAEADLARQESMTLSDGLKLRSWSSAVYGFAGELIAVQQQVDEGVPVEMRHLHGQVIGVSTEERTVILTHPRSDQQQTFERLVLQDFCSLRDCQSLTSQLDEQEWQTRPAGPDRVIPKWDFSESGPICSHSGIQLRFTSMAKLSKKKLRCSELMQEAETLARELNRQRRHAVQVDWERISIQAAPGRSLHLVTLNPSGDSILTPLPLIKSTPALLSQLTPWLQYRYNQLEEQPVIELDAQRYGW